MPDVRDIDVTEPGFITISRAAGPPVRYPVSALLQASDIPTGLTHEQVAEITKLTNLVVVLIRTLQVRGILDETFADTAGMDYDLDALIQAIEAMGGAYHEPDLGDEED